MLIKGQLGITEKWKEYFDQQENDLKEQPLVSEEEEARKLKSLQKVGIKVMPAAKRYSRSAHGRGNAVKVFFFAFLICGIDPLYMHPFFCVAWTNHGGRVGESLENQR